MFKFEFLICLIKIQLVITQSYLLVCKQINWKNFVESNYVLLESNEKIHNKPNFCSCSFKSNRINSDLIKNFNLNSTKQHFLNNTKNMVKLNGGNFMKGTNKEPFVLADYEYPSKIVYVDNFYIDKFEVTNLYFAFFVFNKNYKSEAELLNSSFIFNNSLLNENLYASWWHLAENTYWYKPHPYKSSLFKLDLYQLHNLFKLKFNLKYNLNLKTKFDILNNFHEWIKIHTNNLTYLQHPVVHVSWQDAYNYCKWLDKRLPTENEWEYACKSDHKNKDVLYPWGDELNPNNKYLSNLWQGNFPFTNTLEDGFYETCSVHDLEQQTSTGIKHLIGNVWEWTNDNWFVRKKSGKIIQQTESKIIKGGSFLCHENYCNRYRCSARSHNTLTSTSSNLGFRCAKDA